MIDETGKTLLITPYGKKDFWSHRVPEEAYTGHGSMEVCSRKLCRIIADLYKWDVSRSYRILGTVYQDLKVVIFRLEEAEVIDKPDAQCAAIAQGKSK